MKIAGVILAGGKSQRMGTDKSELLYNGKPLINNAKELLMDLGLTDVFVNSQYGIPDTIINKGPLGGIYSCLLTLREFDKILFIPVDMPCLSTQALGYILHEGKFNSCHFENHPLPCLLENSNSNKKIIEKQLVGDDFSIRSTLKGIGATSLTNNFGETVFININEPKDWLRFIKKGNNQGYSA